MHRWIVQASDNRTGQSYWLQRRIVAETSRQARAIFSQQFPMIASNRNMYVSVKADAGNYFIVILERTTVSQGEWVAERYFGPFEGRDAAIEWINHPENALADDEARLRYRVQLLDA